MNSGARKLSGSFLTPQWLAPPGVRALVTLRRGGASAAPWDSFNLGDHVGDAVSAIATNRALLRRHLPAAPHWLRQVHGTRCVDALHAASDNAADASFTRQRGVVCAVLTADCLPVLLCDEAAQVVAAAHAGWRGLAAGVIESTVAAMNAPPGQLMAWLGPAIGPAAFEVGDDVRAAFVAHDPAAADAFVPTQAGKWLCNIPLLARQRLQALGLHRIVSVDFCTVRDHADFFSYRRDGITGRMASCIWLEDGFS
jgi:YfiH family protein